MPPLPEALATILKTNATAALAALMVIAEAHRGLFAWASRMIGVEPAAPPKPQPEPNSGGRLRSVAKTPKRAKSNGHRAPRGNGYDPRRAKRNADDEALVAAMRSNPEGLIQDWATTIHKSRTSVVSALHRLKDAGLVANEDRVWRLIEERAPRAPIPRWTKPLSGAEKAPQVHLTAS